MIKPLQSVSNVAFKSSLEDYQDQIKNKKEPKYQLTLSPGSDYAPEQKPSFKKGVAGIFKGFNNITGVIGGTAKGIGKGIVFGSLAGVVAKNFKENLSTAVKENGKKVKSLAFGQFIKGTVGDLWSFAGNALKAIPEAFKKAPTDSLKSIKDIPKKFWNYMGKDHTNKSVKAVAIGVGVAVLGYNILKAKVLANRKNANIDHSLNLKH